MKDMRFIHNLLPKTLFARFILIITVPVLIGQIAANFLFYDRYWHNIPFYTGKLIASEIGELLNNYEVAHTESTKPEQYLNFSYQFIPKATLSTKQKRLSVELEVFKNILNNRINKRNIIYLKNNTIEVLFEFDKGIMKIVFPSKLLMDPTAYIIFVSSIVSLTILFLSISIIFCKKQIKSILELTKAADAFGRGFPYAYKPIGAKEIRYAGIALLKMKERIGRQVAQRTQMLAMISHDLRTPLTRMKLQIELMPDFEEKNDLKEDIETMQNMVDSYLAFVRGEGGEEFQIVSLSDWLKNIIKNKWSSSDITFNIEAKNEKVRIKPNSFERAISNLISNALQYGSKIKISIYHDKNNLILDIEDNGSGIKDEEKRLAFKPFYRSDKSRSLDNNSNVGLGLSIAKEIIIKNYGTILLEDSKELGGLLVRVSLPSQHSRFF